VFIVSNQSGSPQTLTFETEEIGGSSPGIRKRSTEIADRGTGSLQADVREGTYQVGVLDSGIRPATVEVSGERASAQDQLLQP